MPPDALSAPKKPAKVPPAEAHLEAAAAFERDPEAEFNRLLRLMRRKGFMTHGELVEVLGAGEVEVEHHDVIESRAAGDDQNEPGRLAGTKVQAVDEDGNPVFHQETGKAVMIKAGTRTVAHDSHTSRAFVAEVLGPEGG